MAWSIYVEDEWNSQSYITCSRNSVQYIENQRWHRFVLSRNVLDSPLPNYHGTHPFRLTTKSLHKNYYIGQRIPRSVRSNNLRENHIIKFGFKKGNKISLTISCCKYCFKKGLTLRCIFKSWKYLTAPTAFLKSINPWPLRKC